MRGIDDELRDFIRYDNLGARDALRHLLAKMPKSARVRAMLAESHLRSFEPEAARDLYRTALDLAPVEVSLHHQLGLCAILCGDPAEALRIFREAAAFAPAELSKYMVALLLHRLGRLDEATSAFRELTARLDVAHGETPYVLRSAAMASRDAGALVESDCYARELHRLRELNPAQICSTLIERDNTIDFHEWTRLSRKDEFAALVARRYGKNAGALNFPATYSLPDARAALLDHARREPDAFWVAKPQHGTGGQGVVVTRNVAEFADLADVVVQRYLDRPHLVDGCKSVLRLYVFTTSVSPLRAYLYGDGIVRFAPDRFESGLGNARAHVTNTARHRDYEGLILSADASQESFGHVWSVNAYRRRLDADGLDASQVWIGVRALIKEMLAMLEADGLFARQSASAPRRSYAPKLFGVDVLIDEKGKAWLIELEKKPALGGLPLVDRIHNEMFNTMFEMTCPIIAAEAEASQEIARLIDDPAALDEHEARLANQARGKFERLV